MTKCTKKSYSIKKNFFTAQGAPCVLTKIFILEYLFLGTFFWGEAKRSEKIEAKRSEMK
jgi:hypothetical protein